MAVIYPARSEAPGADNGLGNDGHNPLASPRDAATDALMVELRAAIGQMEHIEERRSGAGAAWSEISPSTRRRVNGPGRNCGRLRSSSRSRRMLWLRGDLASNARSASRAHPALLERGGLHPSEQLFSLELSAPLGLPCLDGAIPFCPRNSGTPTVPLDPLLQVWLRRLRSDRGGGTLVLRFDWLFVVHPIRLTFSASDDAQQVGAVKADTMCSLGERYGHGPLWRRNPYR